MKCISGRRTVEKKQGASFLFVSIVLLGLLFIQVDTGKAQEPIPSATMDGNGVDEIPSPTATLEIVETGTNTPEMEADPIPVTATLRSSNADKTRILITISSRAQILNVMARANNLGNLVEIPELSRLGVFAMDVPADQVSERIAQLQTMTGVLYVEPDYPVWATDTYPNDPGFASQYALTSIRAPQGWDTSTGSSAITIAILDSGVDFGHLDLAGKLTAGFDFVNSDTNPQDDYGHGTHVAGIAAALGNNSTGIAGVSWGAKIMPVKVLNSSGNGSYSIVASGIVWAVDNGAQVINMSLGGAGNPDAITNPSALRLAVLYAYNNNVLMVASSGNTGSSFVLYPARYPEVMAVGASNMSDQPWSLSNYGAEVDVAAPGENIYSLWPGGYQIRSGTSMSAPHVSGLAAILYGYINNAGSVRNTIESTALDIGPVGWDLYSGAGLIQMDAALALIAPPTSTPTVLSSGNGPGNGNVFLTNGLLSLPTATASYTPTPLSLSTPVTTTQTAPSLLENSPSSPTITATPERENKIKRIKVFFSPYFCGAVFMILSGLWLIWRQKRKRNLQTNL